MRKLREIKPIKKRKRKNIVVRRFSKKDKSRRLKKPYLTKLGRQLRSHRIENTSRVKPLEG